MDIIIGALFSLLELLPESIYRKILRKLPRTRLVIYKSSRHIKIEGGKRTKITLKPIKTPKKKLENADIPLIVDWSGDNSVNNCYTLAIDNASDYDDTNIVIKVSMKETSLNYLISKISLDDEARINVIEGGNKASFVKIHIPELLRTERRTIRVFTNAEIDNYSISSAKLHNIKDIWYFEIVSDEPAVPTTIQK